MAAEDREKTLDILPNPKKVAQFTTAMSLIAPVIEQHGLEPQSSGPLFNPLFKQSKVEQHIDQILRVADWLEML